MVSRTLLFRGRVWVQWGAGTGQLDCWERSRPVMGGQSSTVKHLLFVLPYFREVMALDIFTRLYFRKFPCLLL